MRETLYKYWAWRLMTTSGPKEIQFQIDIIFNRCYLLNIHDERKFCISTERNVFFDRRESKKRSTARRGIRCVPVAPDQYGIEHFVGRFVCLQKVLVNASELSRIPLHRVLPTMLCVYRPVYPPIDPRSPGCDSLKTFRRKYRKRSRVAASNDVAAISDDIVFDVQSQERKRDVPKNERVRRTRGKKRWNRGWGRGGKKGWEGEESVRILDRLNEPRTLLPLIEQQITGIVSRFYSETGRYDARSGGNW